MSILPDVASDLGELMSDADPPAAKRASDARMKMVKIDIRALRDAASG